MYERSLLSALLAHIWSANASASMICGVIRIQLTHSEQTASFPISTAGYMPTDMRKSKQDAMQPLQAFSSIECCARYRMRQGHEVECSHLAEVVERLQHDCGRQLVRLPMLLQPMRDRCGCKI